jgi:hypothetical protein
MSLYENTSNQPGLDSSSNAVEKILPFKQFHHQGDAACDFSCMAKARDWLVQNGFKDEGAYIVSKGRRKIANHFWQDEYNEAMINFFKKYAGRAAR